MTPTRYHGIAIALHWLIALLLICGFALGLYMVDLKFSPQKLSFYSYHKWIGVTVFSFALLRVLWRLTHRPPPLPASVPPWQAAASNATHLLLYVFLLAAPLSGWLYSSAAGVPTVPFGIAALQLPDLIEKNRELAGTLKFVHLSITYSFAALVVLHVAAVFKHMLIDRDGIMRRMLPIKHS
jgi:cytochrome b561